MFPSLLLCECWNRHTSDHVFHNLSLPAPGPARVPAASNSISDMRKTDPVYSGTGIACASPATRYVNHWLESENYNTRLAIEYSEKIYSNERSLKLHTQDGNAECRLRSVVAFVVSYFNQFPVKLMRLGRLIR